MVCIRGSSRAIMLLSGTLPDNPRSRYWRTLREEIGLAEGIMSALFVNRREAYWLHNSSQDNGPDFDGSDVGRIYFQNPLCTERQRTRGGLSFKGILEAPTGFTTISPISTLTSLLLQRGATSAEAQVLMALSINPAVDISNFDPIAQILSTQHRSTPKTPS